MAVFKQQYELLKRDLQRTENNLAVMRMPGNTVIPLVGTSNAPNAKALIYWNKAKKTVYVDANDLPSPPGGRQYQLWVIKDGVYKNGGVFNYQPDKDNLFQLRNADAADGFMISLELIPGSQQPDLEKVVAQSKQ